MEVNAGGLRGLCIRGGAALANSEKRRPHPPAAAPGNLCAPARAAPSARRRLPPPRGPARSGRKQSGPAPSTQDRLAPSRRRHSAGPAFTADSRHRTRPRSAPEHTYGDCTKHSESVYSGMLEHRSLRRPAASRGLRPVRSGERGGHTLAAEPGGMTSGGDGSCQRRTGEHCREMAASLPGTGSSATGRGPSEHCLQGSWKPRALRDVTNTPSARLCSPRSLTARRLEPSAVGSTALLVASAVTPDARLHLPKAP
ncbi:PREDICTED: uncharacterized protein LOC102009291 [Chinchilla lanigera]|uniref:uncharacterized protein LOC102009291 n=1 Tax=Chinchilla lanigera TaxID=34839 RepID=UPI00038F1474|nr:PREDICTED: uncharacterized protein LOC102009291 [Chinchilla lanigera]XP_005405670.1 PREDICTED: uncharacterized protein LOC102009291 [Chinchilla lanigera]XP_005405671.1 PREDICTED: uncharacterized protein LOC102009291 [Chinchilla lanigera]XP_013360602.1 PREDICTED: uncharacterized protein LOC102009291 [Chinchilla lanigera]